MFQRFSSMTSKVRDSVQKILSKFDPFLKRRKEIESLEAQISPLEKRLKALKVDDKADTNEIAAAVLETGRPVIYNGYRLQADETEHVKKTSIGVKELLEGVQTHEPRVFQKVQAVLHLLEQYKSADNKASAEKRLDLEVRPATHQELEAATVHHVWTL